MKLTHLIESSGEAAVNFSDFVSNVPERYQESLLDIGHQLIKLGYQFDDEDMIFTDPSEDHLVSFGISANGGNIEMKCDTGGSLSITYTMTSQGLKSRPIKDIIEHITDATNALDRLKNLLPGGTTKRKIEEA